MSQENNRKLDRVFAAYREATSNIDSSPQFLAGVWRRIEEQRPVGWLNVLGIWSPRLAAAAVAAAALLTFSTWLDHAIQREQAVLESSYVEALTADSLDEHDEALWVLAGRRR